MMTVSSSDLTLTNCTDVGAVVSPSLTGRSKAIGSKVLELGRCENLRKPSVTRVLKLFITGCNWRLWSLVCFHFEDSPLGADLGKICQYTRHLLGGHSESYQPFNVW